MWRISRQRAHRWRSWEGQVVVYDDVSGDTVKLDFIMAEVFQRLLRAPATQGEIAAHLALALGLEVDMKLQRLAGIALERFGQAGLVEPVSAGRAPASSP